MIPGGVLSDDKCNIVYTDRGEGSEYITDMSIKIGGLDTYVCRSRLTIGFNVNG